MSLFLPAAAGFRPGLRGSVSSAGSILVRGAPFPAFSGALSVPPGRTARPGGAGPGLDAAAVRRSASPASVRLGAAPARRIPADRVGSLPVCLEPRRRGDGLVRQSSPAFAADRRGAGGPVRHARRVLGVSPAEDGQQYPFPLLSRLGGICGALPAARVLRRYPPDRLAGRRRPLERGGQSADERGNPLVPGAGDDFSAEQRHDLLRGPAGLSGSAAG